MNKLLTISSAVDKDTPQAIEYVDKPINSLKCLRGFDIFIMFSVVDILENTNNYQQLWISLLTIFSLFE